VSLNGSVLLCEDVLAQSGSQFGNAGEAVDVGRFAHDWIFLVVKMCAQEVRWSAESRTGGGIEVAVCGGQQRWK
jgi:hypothetical protein